MHWSVGQRIKDSSKNGLMTGGRNYIYFTKDSVRSYIKCLESRRKIILASGLIVVIMNIPTGPSHLLFLDYNYMNIPTGPSHLPFLSSQYE